MKKLLTLILLISSVAGLSARCCKRTKSCGTRSCAKKTTCATCNTREDSPKCCYFRVQKFNGKPCQHISYSCPAKSGGGDLMEHDNGQATPKTAAYPYKTK